MSGRNNPAKVEDTQLVSLPSPRHTKYGIIRAAAFNDDTTLPRETEVVIIGGGIIGAFTALQLAQRNIPVLLCEKAEIGCESSSRAFGLVSELLLDPVKQPMTQQAKAMWQDLGAQVGETGYRQEGLVYLADRENELEFYRSWIDQCRGMIDPNTTVLTSAQIAERFPTATRKFAGGLFCPSDGAAEPVLAATAIAQAARRAGARIVTGCAVRGLDIRGGQVAGVFTEKGRVGASRVLCAANTWTRLFCGNHGIDIPQLYVIMSMGSTSPTAGPVGAGGQEAWAWRRQIDGGYSLGGVTGVTAPATRDALRLYKSFKPMMAMMGSARPTFGRDAWNDFWLPRRWDVRSKSPFEKLRMVTGSIAERNATDSLRLNSEVFPEMGQAGVVDYWAGSVTVTPDNKPILSAVDKIPGFYVATGCSYGISWAPAVGKLMADMMMGRSTDFDSSPFRLSRFTDGSSLEISH